MTENIVKLREMTGAGVMECKRALEEAKGDFDKAVAYIHERGLVKADTKKERKTGAGLLHAYIHNNRVGVLLEVRCETDFVARSEPFKEMVHNFALHIAAMGSVDVPSLLKEPFIKDESITIEETLKGVIAQTGENMKIERFCRFEL